MAAAHCYCVEYEQSAHRILHNPRLANCTAKAQYDEAAHFYPFWSADGDGEGTPVPVVVPERNAGLSAGLPSFVVPMDASVSGTQTSRGRLLPGSASWFHNIIVLAQSPPSPAQTCFVRCTTYQPGRTFFSGVRRRPFLACHARSKVWPYNGTSASIPHWEIPPIDLSSPTWKGWTTT